MLDGVGGFDTNDLFTPHPTNPDLWKIYGRADDQIMHSNGEKVRHSSYQSRFQLDIQSIHIDKSGPNR